jgi:cytochrome c553
MREFRDRRTDSVMHRIAKGYRDEDYQQLARYFRQLDQAPPR